MKTSLFRLQYELDTPHSERAADNGAKLFTDAVGNAEVKQVLAQTRRMGYREQMLFLHDKAAALEPCVVTIPITTRTPESLAYHLEGKQPELVFLLRPIHSIDRLNEHLATLNRNLSQGAYLCCHAMTSILRRKLIQQRYPWGIRTVLMGWEYMWHRVCPKLWLTHRLYFSTTHGKTRSLSRVEILGRLYRAGFEVIDEQYRDSEFFVIARKATDPINDTPPTGSPIIHLRRIGKGGNEIVVHKFRTMYTYSEYIQGYVYQYQNLDRGGKFKDDYRVNFWGRQLRRTWLDELPMLWNLIRGDIKLVGVRPLSRQYFSLYSPEMQQLRIRTKPGLLPPFYYDDHTPETIDEVQASERRYLEAYLQHPFATDWRYFWGIVGNIVFKRKRSK